MDKAYEHKDVEEKLYKHWEEKGYFKPEINDGKNGKSFSIVLPPPNANGSLHFGHALMVIQDILIRYHRMKGDKTLWVPGADHAGFETQFVFEKKLQAEGKSRFDFDRDTLYQMIWEYVQENKSGMENQLRKLGFSLDWSREKFTLDPDIMQVVYKTFKKLFEDELVYRGNRLVNYCTKDGTSFSDLEVVTEEADGSLYEIHYQLKDKNILKPVQENYIKVATTRPETMFGDVAIMVHPDDPRYKDYIGKTAIIPLTTREIPIIADEYVDMKFGTGAVKVTPLHDFNDYEVAKRHTNLLEGVQIIGFDGKLQNTGVVDGLYVKKAREEVVNLLHAAENIGEITSHKMVLKKCYKCKTVLEPLPLDQWYVKVDALKEKAIEAVKKGDIKINPSNFETHYFQWLENLRDWNISRQIVWGIRIPAWQCADCQKWTVTNGEKPTECSKCASRNLKQDEDTFDTWFSSAQWPFATVQTTKPGDYEDFYPNSVMETGYDILRAWVSRMVMIGLYVTGKVPFNDVVLHGLVNDPYGKKMSKSKGNVVNPLELVEQYGADAVRMALVYGTALGHDQALSYPKLDAMRKFTNKLWNMARFIEFKREGKDVAIEEMSKLKELAQHENDKAMVEKVAGLVAQTTKNFEKYDFNHASQELYDFAWHEFADIYIEDVKNRIDDNSLMVAQSLYVILLKLLHPFMPFVTEEIYQKLPGHGESLMIESWPQA